MKFLNQSGGIVQISEKVSIDLKCFRQISDMSKESGGILLGRILKNNLDIIVDQITTPSEEDRSARFSFYRAVCNAQKIVTTEWKRSNGTQNYLGEWHSHPEDHPTPSSVDIENWKRVFRRSKIYSSELYFVIVGRKTTKVWSLNNRGADPKKLPRVPHH